MIQHILFDNDGTIVDSEFLAMRMMLDALRPHGLEMDIPTYARTFPGFRTAKIIELLQRDHGVSPLPHDFHEQLEHAHVKTFDLELKVIEGMDKVFRGVKIPKSMVSNGSSRHVQRCLERVGLIDAFSGSIFGVELVENPKPAPDLYLHALAHLGLRTDQVIAIEDSPAGVSSAKAAGVRVIGFLGASHIGDGHGAVLEERGADYIAADAKAVWQLFEKLGIV
jgi:HAD superfamily hydrolase (TIGR01509 family)